MPAPERLAEQFEGHRPHVRAVTWDHWSDADPHMAPSAGLVEADGRAKPLLGRLRALRAAHLK